MVMNKSNGKLEVICGCMFSGKSEELIRRMRQAKQSNLSVKVFKPVIDDRYANNSVVSHNGSSIPAKSVEGSKEILGVLHEGFDVIGIDETQFFDDKIVSVLNILANKGIRVIAAGLDTDFRGEPFGQMSALIATSDSVTKLNAICSICGALASRTQRLIHGEPASYNDPIIFVGASESYEPRCRLHHKVPGKPTYERH